MTTMSERPQNVFGAKLSRRQFVKTGGVLVVGFSLVGPELLKGDSQKPAVLKNSLDPTLGSSWIEIHADNTILIRTGKSDFGQGTTFTAYRQIVADELSVPFEAITTVVAGDTDRTPDGSGAFDFLGRGTPNIRKAAAYTYQALLDLASERLGTPKEKLSVKDGIVSGGGKSISYGDLIKNQELKLTIPVKGDLTSIMGLRIEGDPPMKPVSEYTVIGKSFKNSVTSSKVAAKETWATDVRLPGMLHARVVHPKTLGSNLISAGQLDKTKFPNSQVIVKGNLVGVVAPTEWEAIQAAEQVAGSTKWTEWKGLPGNAKLYQHLRDESDWASAPVGKGRANKGDVGPVLASAHKKLSATYQVPFMKHAPIGPTMAVADVKADGTVHIYTHNQNPQELRGEIAMMLRTTPDHVIVHAYPGPGHYGRSNGGNAGAEDEAVLLSRHSANRSACSGCAPTICSGPRNRRLRFPIFRLPSTKKAKSPRIKATTLCPPCRTTGPSGRSSPGYPPCRLPMSILISSMRRPTPLPIRGFTPRSRMWWSRAMAHFRWDRKRRHSPSVSATTACGPRCSTSRIFRANWR